MADGDGLFVQGSTAITRSGSRGRRRQTVAQHTMGMGV